MMHEVFLLEFTAPCRQAEGKYVAAVGLETGDIALFVSSTLDSWSAAVTFAGVAAHTGTITRLRFKPTEDADEKQNFTVRP